MRTTRKIAAAAFGAAAMMAMAAGPALADGTASGTLSPIPLSGETGSGTAKVSVSGTTVSVTLAASGLLAGSPHAAHIHFSADATHTCPSASADKDGNGHISVTEAAGNYGAIVVSLTTSGDTSASSGLAVDRFSTAPGGNISYYRGSITVSSAVASAIENGQSVVVVHGNDYNKDGKYDGTAKSDLDPSLPAEATDPALCGVLTASPSGGMATGQGGAQGGTNDTLLALGGVALVGAAGAGVVAARRRKVQA